VDEEALAGRECFTALDLASVIDLAALCRVFPPLSVDEPIKLLWNFWIPKDNIRARVLRDRVPYDAWVRDGWVEATEGDVIDNAVIHRRVSELNEATPFRQINFDRWGATAVMTALADAGLTVVQFGQGYQSMSPPMKELYRLLLARKIAHGGNPVARWMAANVMAETDAAGNIKPSRKKSREKIDGVVAAIMALDGHLRTGGSIYEQQGLRFL
jgi:phage terminase large subunit-like protein